MIRLAQGAYFSALALWVGGLAALAFVVAPTLFRNAPSRAVAGALFGAVLRTFGYVEMACAGLVALCTIAFFRQDGRSPSVEWVRVGFVAVMLLLMLSYTLGVNPATAEERLRIPNFDALPEGAPEKARFDRLHRWAVRLMAANLLAGASLLAFSAATLRSVAPR